MKVFFNPPESNSPPKKLWKLDVLTSVGWNKDNDSFSEYLISHCIIHKLSGSLDQKIIFLASCVSCCACAFQPQKWFQMKMHYPQNWFWIFGPLKLKCCCAQGSSITKATSKCISHKVLEFPAFSRAVYEPLKPHCQVYYTLNLSAKQVILFIHCVVQHY